MDEKKVNNIIGDLESVIKVAHQMYAERIQIHNYIPIESLEIIVCALKQMNIPDKGESFDLPESWKAAVMKSFMETE